MIVKDITDCRSNFFHEECLNYQILKIRQNL